MTDKPPKKPRGRPKTVDRQRAIEIAMGVYWQEGPSAVSLNELCRRAGLSKPSLYREFGGEDGLMAAALAHYEQLAVAPLIALFAAELPLAQMLDMAVVGMTSDRGTPAGCLFTELRLAMARLGPLTTARVEAIEQERRGAFEARYKNALDKGEANANLTPAFAARYLDTQLSTVLLQMGSGEPPDLVRSQARLALGVLVSEA